MGPTGPPLDCRKLEPHANQLVPWTFVHSPTALERWGHYCRPTPLEEHFSRIRAKSKSVSEEQPMNVKDWEMYPETNLLQTVSHEPPVQDVPCRCHARSPRHHPVKTSHLCLAKTYLERTPSCKSHSECDGQTLTSRGWRHGWAVKDLLMHLKEGRQRMGSTSCIFFLCVFHRTTGKQHLDILYSICISRFPLYNVSITMSCKQCLQEHKNTFLKLVSET